MNRVLFLSAVRHAGTRSSSRGRAAAVLLAWLAWTCPGRGDEASFEVHGTTGIRAERIVADAEHARNRAFAALLGVASPERWTVRCEIHLHATAESFAAAVGGPPDGGRGATSIEFSAEQVGLRRIDLLDDDPAAVPAALAHEVVHVVLADRFTAAPPPRWADEGLAMLFDDAEKQAGHARDFAAARRTGMTWSAAHLMALEDYPREPHRQRVFYGQSAALVRWLIERRDAATLLAFLDDAATLGHAAALQRHYGFTSAAALERAWLSGPTGSDVGTN